jgi:hypothetical protein
MHALLRRRKSARHNSLRLATPQPSMFPGGHGLPAVRPPGAGKAPVDYGTAGTRISSRRSFTPM